MQNKPKEIPLTKGLSAIVDEEQFEYLNQWKWHAMNGGKHFYAARRVGKGPMILMHRLLMNAEKGQMIDHKDRNSLNNCLSNLRFCTKQQNGINCGPKRKAIYKGVFKNKQRWSSMLQKDGICYYLGSFETREIAAMEYDKKAKEFYGEFAYLNFPNRCPG